MRGVLQRIGHSHNVIVKMYKAIIHLKRWESKFRYFSIFLFRKTNLRSDEGIEILSVESVITRKPR